MTDYPVLCKKCNERNIITIDDDKTIKTMDCDNHKCVECGEVGMQYPKIFDE